MAQLYPDFEQISKLKVPPTAGEQRLLTFLDRNLGNEYEVYFQPFLNGDRPDVIVMRKTSGVLVLEVKDWHLDSYYVDRGGKWRLRENDASIVSPFEQVQSYKKNLFNLHIDHLLDNLLRDNKYFALVSCAIYFHCHDEAEARHFCDDRHIEILGRDSLNEGRLCALLGTCYLDGRASKYFSDAIYTNLRRHLTPPMHTKEEGKEIVYTPKQKALVESRAVEQKIRGVAGSGKTTVLAARAVNACLRTGSRVLVLTFNITLRNYIHDKISEVKGEFGWDKFHIIHYHLFFAIEANNYNLPVNWKHDPSNITFFADVEQKTLRYDAIFVDEIQDYETDWIRIIKRYFLTPGGEFVVCGDEKQNVYGRDLAEDNTPNTTIPGRWNELTDSFRSNSKIINLAFEFQDYFFSGKYDLDAIDIVEQPDLFKEAQCITYVGLASSVSPDQLFETIHGRLERLGIPPNDVVVLSSKIELLRELDFLFRTRAYETTTTTFESREEYEQLKAQPDEHEEERLR